MTRDLDIVPTAMAMTLSILFIFLFYFIVLAVGQQIGVPIHPSTR